MSTPCRLLSTGYCDPMRSQASALSEGEVRCPEKGGNVIAAGRCVERTDCPQSKTCHLRAHSLGILKYMRDHDGVSASRVHERAEKRKPAKDCRMCFHAALPRMRTCGPVCEEKWQKHQAAIKCGGPGSHARKSGRAIGPNFRSYGRI